MRTGPTSSAPARPGVRVLRDLLRENTASVCAALILSLAATAATLAIPWLVRDLIEVLGRQESVVGVLVWMVPLALGAAAASSLSGYLLARTGERLVLRLRSRVMEHSLRLPLSDVRAAGRATSSPASPRTRCSCARWWTRAWCRCRWPSSPLSARSC
ncbi:ABC transporter transmembrane domain-containing protein [Streptomyces thermocarboxydus]